MNGFALLKAKVEGDHKPTWLLFLPGRHHEALAIPDGNMVEIIEQWREQGGFIEQPTASTTEATK